MRNAECGMRNGDGSYGIPHSELFAPGIGSQLLVLFPSAGQPRRHRLSQAGLLSTAVVVGTGVLAIVLAVIAVAVVIMVVVVAPPSLPHLVEDQPEGARAGPRQELHRLLERAAPRLAGMDD